MRLGSITARPDAVEMLAESDLAAWTVLQYLPALDLEAAPPLCEKAGSAPRRPFEKVHWHAADDPDPPRSFLTARRAARSLPL